MKQYAGNRFASAFSAIVLALFVGAPDVLAHHSAAAYDRSTIVEARGEVVGMVWRNPHVRFQVSTKAFDGNDEVWRVEARDLNSLDRSGLARDVLKIGDVVRFAGNPAVGGDRRMFGTNLLLTDGRELLFSGVSQEALWAPPDRVVDTGAHLAADASLAVASVTETPREGILGKVFFPSRPGQPPEWVADPPLTADARSRQALYDETVDDPVLGCVSPGMPRVMLRRGRFPIRFVERGSDLVLQSEWFEIERVIHMDGREPSADHPYTALGYSAGEWEGDTLVITTTHIDSPYFELYGLVGVPQSRAVRFVERFTLLDGGTMLAYGFSATDPAAFTEAVTYENYTTFSWRPDQELMSYDCVEER